jgi:hypothetical protein
MIFLTEQPTAGRMRHFAFPHHSGHDRRTSASRSTYGRDPVQLFTATTSQDVASHLLHAKCGSRIQKRLECAIPGIVPREETVKGYETAKDECVHFEPEELKALEKRQIATAKRRGGNERAPIRRCCECESSATSEGTRRLVKPESRTPERTAG